MSENTCCFFGHSNISETKQLMDLLIKQIEFCITTKNITQFLFGGYKDFDHICYKAVTQLKVKYPNIKTIYVQAYYNHKEADNIKYLHLRYNEIFYPEIEDKPKRFAIVYRNQAMIYMSDYCIFYVNRSWGGAMQALKYAKRKKKDFINIAELGL